MRQFVDGGLVERPGGSKVALGGRTMKSPSLWFGNEPAGMRAAVVGSVAAEADVGTGRGDQLLGGLKSGWASV